MKKIAECRPKLTHEEIVNEAVFKGSFIPRTLDEVIDFERDTNIHREGGSTDHVGLLLY